MNDARHMAHALSLAARGLGRVWPNPAVGCVIVAGERVVGRGWTRPGGRPHAETEALAMAGPAARGATAYVSLEPCAHHGETPPCARALVDSGVARVVAAMRDPDLRVNGSGLEMLRAAGVDVSEGVLEREATALQRGFLNRIRTGRPSVTLKLAGSLDGRIATSTGESRWITGPDSRRVVHAMRARHDAVLVGGGTARADDPSLTARDLGTDWQPIRVVLSRRLDLPMDGQLARTASEVPVWLCHGRDAPPDIARAWSDRGARLFSVQEGDDHLLDPVAALRALGEAGLTRILCEGGGKLAASLIVAGLVDEVVVFSAGLALGAEGWPMLGEMDLERLAEAPRFGLVETRPANTDALIRWTASH